MRGVASVFDPLTEQQTKKIEKMLNAPLATSKLSEEGHLTPLFDDPLLGESL